MPPSRRSPITASTPRRPCGPRCHGGASSLLRLGLGTGVQRVAAPTARNDDGTGDDAVEHVVGWSGRGDRSPRVC